MALIKASFCFFLAVVLFGCEAFLPAHEKSYKFDEEKVDIQLIPDTDGSSGKVVTSRDYRLVVVRGTLEKNREEGIILASADSFSGLIEEAKKLKALPPFALLQSLSAAGLLDKALGVAIDFAVDTTEKQLVEESKRYEDQFKTQILIDDFWQRGSSIDIPRSLELTQLLSSLAGIDTNTINLPKGWNLFALEVTSYYKQKYEKLILKRTIFSDKTGKTEAAFSMECDIQASKDQQAWAVKPTKYTRSYAKCKVLNDWWLTKVLIYGFFLNAKEQVETDVALEWTSLSRQFSKDGTSKYVHETIGSHSFRLPTQDLKKAKTEFEVGGKTGGWFPAYPISYDYRGEPVGLGTGTLKIVVTERDKSSAKKYLEKAAAEVAAQAKAMQDAEKPK